MSNKKFTIKNENHNTTYRVISAIGKSLSPDQLRRSKKTLCGDLRCACSDRTGALGEQEGFTITKLTDTVFQLTEK